MKLKVPANLGKKPAAVVVFKSGPAQFSRAQEAQWKEIFIKLGLYSEDQIKTGPFSSVHLQLANAVRQVSFRMTLLPIMPSQSVTPEFVFGIKIMWLGEITGPLGTVHKQM
jgi:hypothetical protein